MPPDTAWWHAHFIQHPFRYSKNADQLAQARAGASGKYKEYCRLCFEAHRIDIINEVTKADQTGLETSLPRTDEAIREYFWGLKAAESVEARGYRVSNTATLVNHLARCRHQPEEVIASAWGDKACTLRNGRHQRLSAASGLRTTPLMIPTPLVPASGLGLLIPPSFHPGTPGSLSPLIMSPNASPAQQLPGYISSSASPAIRPEDSASNLSSRNPSAGPSRISNSYIAQSRRGSAAYAGSSVDLNLWGPERQLCFENRLARLTTSAGLPLSWVDNPEWIEFVKEFLHPSVKSPSRKVLTTRVIPQLVEQLKSEAKNYVQGKNATIQSDGWTGENHRHLIAFMITADKRVFTVRVDDVSAERKTAPNLLSLLEKAIDDVQQNWGATVVAVVTDASGECRKAKRDLESKFPWIIVLDCFAHQVNLVVGDYFAEESPVLKITDQATDLITWMRSKKIVIALLRQAQEDAQAPLLNVLRAVLTRWTSHFRAYERLLLIQSHLRTIVYTDEGKAPAARKIVAGEASAKAKATKMSELIKDNSFWAALARVVRHLRPLAAAANIIQSAFCRLDTVVLTFGYLIALYSAMDDPDDIIGCNAIINSLEKRWAATNQEIFLVAIMLNPFYRREPFRAIPEFTFASITTLIGRVYQCLFRSQTVPDELYAQLRDYLNNKGIFEHTLQAQLAIETRDADREKRDLDPENIFNAFSFGDTEYLIFQLARRVLSITANSASCERLFSAFGILLTKHRNRSTLSTLLNQVELKARTRDDHHDQQKQKELRQRFLAQGTQYSFENQPQMSTLPPDAPPTNPSTTVPTLHSSNLLQASSIPRRMNTRPNPSSSTSDAPPSNTFRDLIHQHMTQASIASADLLDFEEAEGPLNRRPRQAFPKLTLRQIFDFDKVYWKNLIQDKVNRSYQQELELFQMLDLDGDGNDVGADVDETTADVLGR